MEFNSVDLVRLRDEDGTPYACFTLAKGHDHYPKKKRDCMMATMRFLCKVNYKIIYHRMLGFFPFHISN